MFAADIEVEVLLGEVSVLGAVHLALMSGRNQAVRGDEVRLVVDVANHVHPVSLPRVTDIGAGHPEAEPRELLRSSQPDLRTTLPVLVPVEVDGGFGDNLARTAFHLYFVKHTFTLRLSHHKSTIALLEAALHSWRHAHVGSQFWCLGSLLCVEHAMLEIDMSVGIAHQATAAVGRTVDGAGERTVLDDGVLLTAGIDITRDTGKAGIAAEVAMGIEITADIAVIDGSPSEITINQRDDAC